MSDTRPLVGVIMGSKSDRETMRQAEDMLARFDVAHESRVLSAHRTPALTAEYASTAASRGLEEIIAGAGGAAHLALGSLYAWSVFVAPLEKEFGWTRTQTSQTFTIAVVCFALTFIAAGRLQDRKGPRICALLGSILVSAGFLLTSFATSLTALYV